MLKIKFYEVKDKEKENLCKNFVISKEKSIFKVNIDGEIPFNFYYTSLINEFQKNLDEILKGTYKKANVFIYVKERFLKAKDHLISFFYSPEKIFYSECYSINIFLAKDFDEFCSIGRTTKMNLPSNAKGRVSSTTLIYLQTFLLDNAKRNVHSKESILGDAHELLHIFFHKYNLKKNGKLNSLPLLFNEGLTVICANQISKDFNEELITAKELFLERINVFDYDKRNITKNRYYQSAGKFMDYLLKKISEKENISYKEAFQKMFNTIGNKDNFDDKNEFNAKNFFIKVFDLNIENEYIYFKNIK
ncbi:hypothetical protein GW835_02250 [archaeon]|nr:hypothetical protein [archaeon]NCP79368.1 hypothetical protein [archaeon]NCP97311.1 hypothetical protein [archaeon]NCQ07135.1 hypothetical protein [archaeon]NCQ50931.1 hypothetical protein [archaeon]